MCFCHANYVVLYLYYAENYRIVDTILRIIIKTIAYLPKILEDFPPTDTHRVKITIFNSIIHKN